MKLKHMVKNGPNLVGPRAGKQEDYQPAQKIARDKKAAKAARVKAMGAKRVRKTTRKTLSKERRDRR